MNQLKTIALLGMLGALLIGISYWSFGGTVGAVIGLVLAGVTNFIVWYYSEQIALSAFNVKPLTPEQARWLKPLVQRLCDRASLPLPGIYIIPTSAANAFATGRSPERATVAITAGLLELLSRDELEAVIAHELSHIKNGDTLTQTVAATVAGAISFLAHQARIYSAGRNSRSQANLLTLLLTATLAPIAASLIQLAISRTREFAADAGAAEITGNPLALANALEKLERSFRKQLLNSNPSFEPLLIINSLKGEFLNNLFSTHPPTSARIEQLRRLENRATVPTTSSPSTDAMKDPDAHLHSDIAPEVFELASRYYAEQEKSYSDSELIEAATEAGIPAQFIEQAITDVRARHRQKLEQQRQVIKHRQMLLKMSAAFLAAIAIWNVWIYNSLSSAALKTEAAWAQVENQLQRRTDLIPNLVRVTQAYAQQEQELISLLVQSRQAYLQAVTSEEKATAMVEVNQAIGRFHDLVATNPQLQSSQLFVNLQFELAGTENRLAVERMRYNRTIQDYNQKIQGFPNSLIAKALGFEKQSFFQATTADVPQIPR